MKIVPKARAASAQWVGDVQLAGRYLAQSLRLMVGVPDYDAYVAHLRARHPEVEPMDRAAFHRERMQARYDGRGRIGRCC